MYVNHVSDYVSMSHSKAVAKIGDHTLPVLLDSGSALNLIDVKYLKQNAGLCHLPWSKSPITGIHFADGREAPVLGEISTTVILGTEMCRCNLTVVNVLPVKVILGMPFLKRYGVIMNFSTDTFSLTSRNQVRVSEKVVIQPHTQQIISVTPKNPITPNVPVLFNAHAGFKSRGLVAASVLSTVFPKPKSTFVVHESK